MFRIPERFLPGKFDIWFQSHQVKFSSKPLCASRHFQENNSCRDNSCMFGRIITHGSVSDLPCPCHCRCLCSLPWHGWHGSLQVNLICQYHIIMANIMTISSGWRKLVSAPWMRRSNLLRSPSSFLMGPRRHREDSIKFDVWCCEQWTGEEWTIANFSPECSWRTLLLK